MMILNEMRTYPKCRNGHANEKCYIIFMFQNQLKRLFSNGKNPNHAKIYFNPFHVIDHFWYPLKTSEVF